MNLIGKTPIEKKSLFVNIMKTRINSFQGALPV